MMGELVDDAPSALLQGSSVGVAGAVDGRAVLICR
jgi:hypothetical protein